MTNELCTTVVTGGDRAYAWGVLLLVASMRRNGMRHPVVAGIVDWPEEMRQRVLALGGVTLWELPPTRRCLACQKPLLMACDQVKTDWVCWADADAIFIGDCSEWLVGETPEEIVVRKYTPVPPDFTPENLAVWRNDVARFCGAALDASRYDTRVNTAFIVIHRKWMEFLKRWQRQIENVLPMDVGIIMKHGSAYFQTDESVLASLLCFDPDAPRIADHYKANGSVDKSRYYAHFAYNPKPWQMWNDFSLRYRDEVVAVAEWLVSEGIVAASDLPRSLRRSWLPFYCSIAFAAPWVWRAVKLKRKLFRRG